MNRVGYLQKLQQSLEGSTWCLLLCILNFWSPVQAQDSLAVDHLEVFELLKQTPEERVAYFYTTANKYQEHSAYEWLDVLERFLASGRDSLDQSAKVHYELLEGQVFFDLGEYGKSLSHIRDINPQEAGITLDIQERLLDLMDDNYGKLGLYQKQLEVRELKRDQGLSNNITFYDIYAQLGLYNKAMKDYILEVKKTIPDTDMLQLAEYHNQVGNFLRQGQSIEVALTKYRKAKGYIEVFLNDGSTSDSPNDIVKGQLLKGRILSNIGKCMQLQKQYADAIAELEEGIQLMEENNKDVYSSEKVENILVLSQCYLTVGKPELAEKYLGVSVMHTDVDNILTQNRLLARYYNRKEAFKEEAFYLQRNLQIRDSIDDYEASIKKQQLATVVEFDLANSRRLMDEQKLELERGRIEIQAKEDRINVVYISLIFVLLGFSGMVYAYLKSIKNQRLIRKQKHIIENALIEKDSLLKEIHHRVKNNLQMVSSLLSLQTKNTKSKAAIEALEEGKTRVKAMALIHQKLYQHDDLSVIEMQGYIESLVNSIQSVYKKGGHNINITIDAEGTELDIDRAIPFGLILNELVSNSFKYAFPESDEHGKIYIHLSKNGEVGYFEYTDNGIGLPEDMDERTHESMGIRLMNRLVNQLQSNLNIDKTGEGVRFWFNFK